MEAVSKLFVLDNRKNFWQSGIYRKEESTTMTLCFKKNLYDNRVKKQSYLQAFFTKK